MTVVLQKVSRLLGRPLTWIGVPELQARGLTHWHLLVAGVVPRGVLDLAVNGGVNWTGRRISPATHEGHQLGPVFDAQLLTSREDRHRAGRYVAKGLPSAEELSAPKTDYRRRVTGQLGRMRAEKGARPRHWRIPPALLHRHAPHARWGDPALRRAARTGHPGRTFAYSRSWPVRAIDLKQRRRDYAARDHSPSSNEWRYFGRGTCVAAALGDDQSRTERDLDTVRHLLAQQRKNTVSRRAIEGET